MQEVRKETIAAVYCVFTSIVYLETCCEQDITNTSLSEDSVKVLGNMCCFLEPRYIQNSNPQILEVLKACSDLSDEQALAVQNLLLSGKTQYGYVYCSTEVVVFVWSDFFVSDSATHVSMSCVDQGAVCVER